MTPEEILEFKTFKTWVKSTLDEMNKTIGRVKLEILSSIKKNNEISSVCFTTVKSNEKCLKDVKKTNENVEETLCNVLVAIRQNEYLQAWHPAQHGYPEMKVVGKHPAKNEVPSDPKLREKTI